MKQIILIILLSLPNFIKGQTCNCSVEIKKVVEQVEQNAASYQHQVVEGNKLYEYQKHKKEIFNYSKKITTQKECLGLTAFYLSYIKDGHSYMTFLDTYLPYKSFKDTLLIQQYYEKDETIGSTLTKFNKSIEGTWHFQDGSFSITIKKNKKTYRNYVGLMLYDKKPFWKKGNVKLEIVKNYKNELGCIYWTQNRLPKYYPINIIGDEMYIGNTFKFYRSESSRILKSSGQTPQECYPICLVANFQIKFLLHFQTKFTFQRTKKF